MASYDVTITHEARAKVREPGLVLLWTILTLGVYYCVWYYKINRELREFGRAQNDGELASSNPWLSLLAVTLGVVLIVPPFVSWWKCTKRIERAQHMAGVEPLSFGLIVGCIFGGAIIGFVWLAVPLIVQGELNKMWKLLPRAPDATEPTAASLQMPPPSLTGMAPPSPAQRHPDELGDAPSGDEK